MSLKAILWALHDAPTDDAQSALVLVALAENAHDNGRYAWPSIATIAHKARCSERTVQRRLRELEATGLIRKGDQRAAAHIETRYRPVVYDLALHRVRGDSLSPLDQTRGDRSGTSGVTAVSDKPTPKPTTTPHTPHGGASEPDQGALIPVATVGGSSQTGNMTTPTATGSRRAEARDDDPYFAGFWTAYPRKLSKGAARKAWPRAVTKVTHPQVLVRAAESFALAMGKRIERERAEGVRHGERDPIAFIPHPATWLNQEKWLDVPEDETAGKPERWRPPRRDEECPQHPGEHRDRCRACASERIAKE